MKGLRTLAQPQLALCAIPPAPEGLEIGVEVGAMLGRGDSGDLGHELADLFLALGEAVVKDETGSVFLLDEV